MLRIMVTGRYITVADGQAVGSMTSIASTVPPSWASFDVRRIREDFPFFGRPCPASRSVMPGSR
jgi:hypothetical protein